MCKWCMLGGLAILTVALVAVVPQTGQAQGQGNEDSRIQLGFRAAPVELNLTGKNRALVGLGSYLVNTVGDCGGCHTFPPFEPGGDPFLGEPEAVNKSAYLSGGAPFFGDFVPRNLTPNRAGRPAGYTYEEFVTVLRTGKDLKQREPHVPGPGPDNDLLQVMPWPSFGKMSDHDLRAIYEYLSAIPCIGSANRCGP